MFTRRLFLPRGLTIRAILSAVLVLLLLQPRGEGRGDEGGAPQDEELKEKGAGAKEAKKADPPPDGGADASQKESAPKRELGIDSPFSRKTKSRLPSSRPRFLRR